MKLNLQKNGTTYKATYIGPISQTNAATDIGIFKIEEVGRPNTSEGTGEDLRCLKVGCFEHGYLTEGSLTNSTGIYKGNFFKGQLHGKCKRYTLEGKLVKEMNYDYGRILFDK
jgi:hypothetical protein